MSIKKIIKSKGYFWLRASTWVRISDKLWIYGYISVFTFDLFYIMQTTSDPFLRISSLGLKMLLKFHPI